MIRGRYSDIVETQSAKMYRIHCTRCSDPRVAVAMKFRRSLFFKQTGLHNSVLGRHIMLSDNREQCV